VDRIIGISLLLVFLATGCGESEMQQQKPYVFSSEVSEKLSVFSKQGPQGATMPLDDVTSFQWDEVHVFPGGSSGEVINKHVGQSIFDQSGYYAERWTLMVFTDQDRVVHALSFVPPLFFNTGRKFTYSRDEAIVAAHSKDPGPYSLIFKE
jgi:hypothetical protein